MAKRPPPRWWPYSDWRPTVYLKFCYALVLLACTAFAQEPEFKGKLEPELVLPARSHQVSDFVIATQSETKAIAGMVGPRDKVFEGASLSRGISLSLDQGRGPREGRSGAAIVPAFCLAYDRTHCGGKIPDFRFKDFSGQTRTLSEFRGKYVLLDFWATWCGPCVGDLPHLSRVYERFRGRGFEIVGMNGDEDESKAHEMIAQQSLGWTHATYASIRETLERSFRIRAWPAYVLLDREGKTFSTLNEDLRGAALDRTIERLLP